MERNVRLMNRRREERPHIMRGQNILKLQATIPDCRKYQNVQSDHGDLQHDYVFGEEPLDSNPRWS